MTLTNLKPGDVIQFTVVAEGKPRAGRYAIGIDETVRYFNDNSNIPRLILSEPVVIRARDGDTCPHCNQPDDDHELGREVDAWGDLTSKVCPPPRQPMTDRSRPENGCSQPENTPMTTNPTIPCLDPAVTDGDSDAALDSLAVSGGPTMSTAEARFAAHRVSGARAGIEWVAEFVRTWFNIPLDTPASFDTNMQKIKEMAAHNLADAIIAELADHDRAQEPTTPDRGAGE